MTTNGNKLEEAIRKLEKMIGVDTSKKDIPSKKVLVKNAKYTSWIKYWEEKTGRKRDTCSNTECNSSENIDGAHVQKVGDNTDTMYIVPLCHKCNMKKDSEEFYIDEELVEAPRI